MSNNINNGGPAFPIHINPGQTYTAHATCDGMTLRDYFAAKAMAAVITGSMADGSHLSDGVEVIFSRAAYKFADAMLRARGEA